MSVKDKKHSGKKRKKQTKKQNEQGVGTTILRRTRRRCYGNENVIYNNNRDK